MIHQDFMFDFIYLKRFKESSPRPTDIGIKAAIVCEVEFSVDVLQ